MVCYAFIGLKLFAWRGGKKSFGWKGGWVYYAFIGVKLFAWRGGRNFLRGGVDGYVMLLLELNFLRGEA